jgi:superoxide dismutase
MSPRQFVTTGTVMIRPLLLKPQWMNGLSERLLVSHYENNYGGALRRLNTIRARLAALDWARTPAFEINDLKREELIAAGSVILHEIYFDSLGGHGDSLPTGLAEPPAGLAQALERDFGSLMAWRTEFTSMAKALAGGSGWTILAWCERLGRLVNQWAADHAHALSGAAPILALDMYEHAYHLDFGAKASAYVDQLMTNLNWDRIGARFRLAIGEGAREDELFLPYGAPTQDEARISAEELTGTYGSLSAQRPAPTHRYVGGCVHARSCRAAALGRGPAAGPTDRGLLHLRISGQRHGREGTATAGLQRQGSRRRDYRMARNWWHDGTAGYLDLRGSGINAYAHRVRQNYLSGSFSKSLAEHRFSARRAMAAGASSGIANTLLTLISHRT